MKALVFRIENDSNSFYEIDYQSGTATEAAEERGFSVLSSEEDLGADGDVFILTATKLHDGRVTADQISMNGTDVCFNFDIDNTAGAYIFENDGQTNQPIAGRVAEIDEEHALALLEEAREADDFKASTMLREALDEALND